MTEYEKLTAEIEHAKKRLAELTPTKCWVITYDDYPAEVLYSKSEADVRCPNIRKGITRYVLPPSGGARNLLKLLMQIASSDNAAETEELKKAWENWDNAEVSELQRLTN